MRPASPVICGPLPVYWPVYSELPSVNSGNCGLPLVSDVVVVVVEAALTVAADDPSKFSVEPDGLVNCRPMLPSAAFNCETADDIPSEKLTPTSSGLALAPFCNGSGAGSVTLPIEIWGGVWVAA